MEEGEILDINCSYFLYMESNYKERILDALLYTRITNEKFKFYWLWQGIMRYYNKLDDEWRSIYELWIYIRSEERRVGKEC